MRTGISQQDAEKRIDDTETQMKAAADKAKQAADEARKGVSESLILPILLDAYRRVHRLDCWSNRRPTARSLIGKAGSGVRGPRSSGLRLELLLSYSAYARHTPGSAKSCSSAARIAASYVECDESVTAKTSGCCESPGRADARSATLKTRTRQDGPLLTSGETVELKLIAVDTTS